jgi:hypothetical protein
MSLFGGQTAVATARICPAQPTQRSSCCPGVAADGRSVPSSLRACSHHARADLGRLSRLPWPQRTAYAPQPTPSSGPRLRREPLPSAIRLRYTAATWAEDRATRGRDPSADPGAKTGVGGWMPPLPSSGIGPQSDQSLESFCSSSTSPRGRGITSIPRELVKTETPRITCMDALCNTG